MSAAATDYSEGEKNLLEILRENDGSPISSKKIADIYYSRRPPRPKHAMRSVVTTLNMLIKKSKFRKNDFFVRKSRRMGPHPVEYWIENKK